MYRRIRAAALAAAALTVGAANARADVSIGSFTVTPSTLQAGVPDPSAGPDVRIDAKLSSGSWDTPDELTLSLAPGLLVDPLHAGTCTADQLQANQCPGGSRIGDGWVTATTPLTGTVALRANLYLVAPQGSEPARMGLVIDFYGSAVESLSAPVTVRSTAGDVGLDVAFAGLPNSWNGVPLTIDELDLTIHGQSAGQYLTRNPTRCGAPATSRIALRSYANATAQASSAFTPTGCAALTYAPWLQATVRPDTGDDGASFQTDVTQSALEGASGSITIAAPVDMQPRLPAIEAACQASDLSQCRSVGWARATSPLLPVPLTGRIVLLPRAGFTRTLTVLFDAPVALRLDAVTQLTGNPSRVTTTFSDLPDMPLTSLTLEIDGGPDSLFVAGPSLCQAPQSTLGSFAALDGATVQRTVPEQVTGCRTTPATPPAAPAGHAPASASTSTAAAGPWAQPSATPARPPARKIATVLRGKRRSHHRRRAVSRRGRRSARPVRGRATGRHARRTGHPPRRRSP
jgi:hypothetical protein